MSYDVWLEIDTGGGEGHQVWDTNYTSNCSRMWYHASSDGEGVAGFHDRNAGDCVALLDDMIGAMEDDPDTYRKMNPANGWGDFDSQLQWLKDMRDAFARHHRCTVKIWR